MSQAFWHRGGRLGAYLLLPLIVALLPLAWLESRPSICLITRLTGRPCPGCGMTRAVASVLHGDIRRAWRQNRLVVVVFPLLSYSWWQVVRREIFL